MATDARAAASDGKKEGKSKTKRKKKADDHSGRKQGVFRVESARRDLGSKRALCKALPLSVRQAREEERGERGRKGGRRGKRAGAKNRASGCLRFPSRGVLPLPACALLPGVWQTALHCAAWREERGDQTEERRETEHAGGQDAYERERERSEKEDGAAGRAAAARRQRWRLWQRGAGRALASAGRGEGATQRRRKQEERRKTLLFALGLFLGDIVITFGRSRFGTLSSILLLCV